MEEGGTDALGVEWEGGIAREYATRTGGHLTIFCSEGKKRSNLEVAQKKKVAGAGGRQNGKGWVKKYEPAPRAVGKHRN